MAEPTPSTTPEYKRLGFFLDFINAAKISYEDVATNCGLCRPTIYHWLRRDDTKLSYIQSVIESCGYKLTILMTRDNFETENTIGLRSLTRDQAGKLELKRLAFLDLALDRYNVSKLELADLLGMSPMGVKTWWVNQDIHISRIYQIADALGCSLKFYIRSNQELDIEEHCNQKRIVSLEFVQKTITIIGDKNTL